MNKNNKIKKICIVLGTRPEITKLFPIIVELKKRKYNFFIIHTNQHYSVELDKIFFKDLKIKKPKYNLGVGSGLHGKMTGSMIIKIEKILIKEKPNIVLVHGDTNSSLAGALSAVKLNIPVGHIEAGLRSYDRKMPEEINRILIDHISNFLFAPTKKAKDILIKEGIKKNKIFNTGNTIVDTVMKSINFAKSNSLILYKLGLKNKKFAILTIHRPSNTENKKNLKSILYGLRNVKKIIFLVHPRVDKKIKEFKIKIPNNIIKVKPIGYFDMLLLMKNSSIIFTDSGGIQEEACILNIPCVTLRDNTERPETLDIGCNILTGFDSNKIIKGSQKMLKQKNKWKNPFGNGKAALKIINILEKKYENINDK